MHRTDEHDVLDAHTVPTGRTSPARTASARREPDIELTRFFSIMSAFPAGVAIITTTSESDEPVGLTTTALCSVSAQPSLLLVCIDQNSRTLPALTWRKRFVVNFVAEKRSKTSSLFASKADNKFRSVTWKATRTGLPLLVDDALAWAECTTRDEIVIGDHTVIVGQVTRGGEPGADRRPLVYYRRSYGSWVPANDA